MTLLLYWIKLKILDMSSYDVLPLCLNTCRLFTNLFSFPPVSRYHTLLPSTPKYTKRGINTDFSTPINVAFMPTIRMKFGSQMSPTTSQLLNMMATSNLHPFLLLCSIWHCSCFSLSAFYANILTRFSFGFFGHSFAGPFLKALLWQTFQLLWFQLRCLL